MINLRNNPQEGIIKFTKYIFIIFSSGPVHCLTRCRGGNLNSVQTKVKPLNHELLSWPLNGQGKAEQPPNISPRSFAFPVLIEERRSGTWRNVENSRQARQGRAASNQIAKYLHFLYRLRNVEEGGGTWRIHACSLESTTTNIPTLTDFSSHDQ